MPAVLPMFFTFLFGLVFGSFLNVCIYRLPREQSIVFPPSQCPLCQKRLQVKDLVPVLSFFLLKGKCRYCGGKIHWRYPVVELINGLGWVGIISFCGFTLQGIAGLLLFSFSLVVALIDVEHYLILNNLVIFLFLCGLIFHNISQELSLQGRVLGMFIGFAIPFFLALISRGGMGGGDIKLCAAMGFWLGFPGIFQAIFIGAFVGSIIGITLLITKVKKRKEPIPFGPFLVLGFFVVFFFEEQLLSWYWSLF
ncbi:MAG: prepilin peptidase [Clostridia bacterium]|nr:prepilin peptidase [Clostridia bacterium]